ncbi:MAG: FAD-dependent oxidoreductase [Candidatus Bathyarchaeia archaeon]
MTEEPRIGVYVCHCGLNIAAVVDVKKVAEFAKSLPNVVVAKDYRYMCSDPGQDLVEKDIKKHGLNRVVVAACSPNMHEATFRKVLEKSGLNPYLFEMANIREQCSWVHRDEPQKATEKSKAITAMAVAKASGLEPLEIKEVEALKRVLVIGGGISGINAALDLAEMGFKVYLVEKNESIGGHMSQLDKTFPTLDCSTCVLGPKMVEIGRHPDVEILAYSEVTQVEGYVGNFKVKVLKKPRYVIPHNCTGCGECSDACPIDFPNEWNMKLAVRKAISIPFDYAVPLVYTLHKDHCIECYKCVDACGDRQAINFEMEPEEIELEVGAIIVATGYDPYDPTKDGEYGYGVYPNVITGLEMERLLSAAGPTGGKISRPSDLKEPKRIAFVQCVGSRSLRRNPYCSRVCCMYSIKQARQLKEKHPDMDVYIFYMDIRAFGKGFEEFYELAGREYKVQFVRGRVAEIEEDPKTHNLIIRAEDTFLGRPVQLEFDMVVLAIGLEPHATTEKLSEILRIARSPDRFLQEAHPKLRPVDTLSAGIFIAGACQGPKDIPDSVAQAKAAAASAAALLSKGKIRIESVVVSVDEELCTGCAKCVDICPFQALSVDEVTQKAKVIEAKCNGCGSCAATCPVGAMQLKHFKDAQVLAMVDAAIPTQKQ